MQCENEKFYLLLSTLFTGLMWILSEIIGSSKCKPNGVFEFVVQGFCVEIHALQDSHGNVNGHAYEQSPLMTEDVT